MRNLIIATLSLFCTHCAGQTICHKDAACDPNALITANILSSAPNCGTFTDANNIISNPNAGICVKQAFTADQPFVVTYVFVANGVTSQQVYEATSAKDIKILKTHSGSDYTNAVFENCNNALIAATGDVTNPNSPTYGNYQIQCGDVSNSNTLCDTRPVCTP